MPRKIKRQQQVSKIPRKKGRYVSHEQVIIEETMAGETETVEESEKKMENNIIEEWIGGGDLTEDETVEDWAEENLKKFEKVEKKLITEALHWHDNAANSIR